MSAVGDLPAFPLPHRQGQPDSIGLTKRELFAAMAPPYPFKMPMLTLDDAFQAEAHVSAIIVKWNVAWADALIAALAKP